MNGLPDENGIVEKNQEQQENTPGGEKKTGGTSAGHGKRNGHHVPRGSCEITGLLEEEGYIVGVIPDPGSPFDLIGWSNAGSILVQVSRPKELVANARNVREQYEKVVRVMEPYYRSETDNIQFMVLSREHGLLRYRVYDWGIGNVKTMQKIMKIPREFPSDQQTGITVKENQRARNSPCPVGPSGLAFAPDITPIKAAIPE
ncbi:MAG: hypothetical protein Q7T80_14865 [Methanoregula sp.]|nr:hypothetical protein [Methanoregula sp.]